MPRWPTAYGPLGLPGSAVGVMTLIILQCFAIPTSSCERRDGEIDGEGPDGPLSAVRARGRGDLISSAIGRPRVLPPPHPLPFPPRGESPPPSNQPPAPSVFSRLSPYLFTLPPRSSTSSSPLSSVVHEPPRALNLFLQLNIRAFASDIVRFIFIFLFFFQLLTTSNFLSFFRLHLPLCLYQSFRFLGFIICNALRRLYVLRRLQTHPLNLLDLFSPLLFVIFFLNHLSFYILDINHYSS